MSKGEKITEINDFDQEFDEVALHKMLLEDERLRDEKQTDSDDCSILAQYINETGDFDHIAFSKMLIEEEGLPDEEQVETEAILSESLLSNSMKHDSLFKGACSVAPVDFSCNEIKIVSSQSLGLDSMLEEVMLMLDQIIRSKVTGDGSALTTDE